MLKRKVVVVKDDGNYDKNRHSAPIGKEKQGGQCEQNHNNERSQPDEDFDEFEFLVQSLDPVTKLFFHYLDLPRWLKILLSPVVFPVVRLFEIIQMRIFVDFCVTVTVGFLVMFSCDYASTYVFHLPRDHGPYGFIGLWTMAGIFVAVLWLLALVGICRRCTLPVMFVENCKDGKGTAKERGRESH